MKRWLLRTVLTALSLLLLCGAAMAESTLVLTRQDGETVTLQVEQQIVETIPDEIVPLAGGSAPVQIPRILLYSLPIAGVTMLGCCAMVLLQDRKQLKALGKQLQEARSDV